MSPTGGTPSPTVKQQRHGTRDPERESTKRGHLNPWLIRTWFVPILITLCEPWSTYWVYWVYISATVNKKPSQHQCLCVQVSAFVSSHRDTKTSFQRENMVPRTAVGRVAWRKVASTRPGPPLRGSMLIPDEQPWVWLSCRLLAVVVQCMAGLWSLALETYSCYISPLQAGTKLKKGNSFISQSGYQCQASLTHRESRAEAKCDLASKWEEKYQQPKLRVPVNQSHTHSKSLSFIAESMV